MLLSRIAPLGAVLVVLSTFTCVSGCALKAEEDDVAASATNALADPSGTKTSETTDTIETIRLSTLPDASSRCDIQTILTLGLPRADSSRYARLHDEVAGGCRIYVDPDPREYLLSFNGTSCGSMMYSANNTRDGRRDRKLTMVDHRTRVCADLVQANLIVTETTNAAAEGAEGAEGPGTGGITRTLYSIDGFVRLFPPE